MAFQVVLTNDAERDLEDIVISIAKHDSPHSAERVLSRILDIANSLTSELPADRSLRNSVHWVIKSIGRSSSNLID